MAPASVILPLNFIFNQIIRLLLTPMLLQMSKKKSRKYVKLARKTGLLYAIYYVISDAGVKQATTVAMLKNSLPAENL